MNINKFKEKRNFISILDIFGNEAISIKYIDSVRYEKKYFIIKNNKYYKCYVQTRKHKGKWSDKILIEKSEKILYFQEINNTIKVIEI
ncbi:MAG: hypothetical protein K2X69_00990 [Silvanigrellaceae bacterium]|nr:hypothetical protein [Silvanigrellaceae bacterium]